MTAPAKTRKPFDAEFSSMKRIEEMLENLDEAARKRIVQYINDRYAIQLKGGPTES